jgi:quinol monooxygenase YgiN
MVTEGLLVRLESKPGHDAEVEAFLKSALPLVRQEPATTAWFAVRFGRSEYGIFDVFPDESGRAAHLSGAVAAALGTRTPKLFAEPPRIQRLSILAHKLPAAPPAESVTKALLLTFRARSGHEQQVEEFLRSAEALVMDEAGTTAWFALRLEHGEYGIFDVFPDAAARFAHLVGHVPRELAKHALTLLGSVPDLHMLEVVGEKVG